MRFFKRSLFWLLSVLVLFTVFSNMFLIDVSASVVDYVDLTPAQTLALYGSTISGSYWNGSEYDSCSFTYCYTFEPSSLNQVSCLPSVKWSDTEKNYMQERNYLIYEMDSDGIVSNDIIPFDDTRITVTLTPSISISGIAYFRQYLGFSYDGNSSSRQRLNPEYNFVSDNFSYSPSPVTFSPKHFNTYGDLYETNFVELGLPFDAIGSPPQSDSGTVPTRCQIYFSVFDCIGQNIVDGIEQTFNFTGQTFSYNKTTSYGWETSSLRDHHYFIMVSCPRLTDGYVIEQPETTSNYGGQLDDITISIGSTNTLLQQIIAKLDLIYAKMDVDISGTVNISSSSVGNIVDGIIDGIHDLFVPSQTDLLNFRTHLMTELHSAFPAFFTAEDNIHDAFQIFDNVQPVSTVRFPGVSVDLPSGVGTDTVAFSLPAQDVELKPEAQRFSVLYDALALIIDIVCTFAVFNMIKHRFHKKFEGSAAD